MPEVKPSQRGRGTGGMHMFVAVAASVAVAVAAANRMLMLQLPAWMLHLFQKYTPNQDKPTNKTAKQKLHLARFHFWPNLPFAFVPSSRTAVKIVLLPLLSNYGYM